MRCIKIKQMALPATTKCKGDLNPDIRNRQENKKGGRAGDEVYLGGGEVPCLRTQVWSEVRMQLDSTTQSRTETENQD